MNEDIYNNSPAPKKYQLYRYSPEKMRMELAVMDGVAVANIYAGDWLYFPDQTKEVEDRAAKALEQNAQGD